MEHFVVSARKYRPQTFKDVVGQSAITNTLQKSIEHNHLAQALLFTGPRGVGKTTCARILAKMINSDGTETEDEDFAFNIFELDAASNNSVDDIRSLTDQVRIPPQVGKYKVYIIDEVHMLSQAAFNAFLKTLEEPPKHCIFILATTEKHKIIPTILSRCQIFDFKRITVKDAKEYLKYIAGEQGITAEDDALHIIAQKADGAMRDALSIFDRVVSFSGKNLTRQAVTENLNVLDYETYFDSTNLILQNKIPELLIQFNTILSPAGSLRRRLKKSVWSSIKNLELSGLWISKHKCWWPGSKFAWNLNICPIFSKKASMQILSEKCLNNASTRSGIPK